MVCEMCFIFDLILSLLILSLSVICLVVVSVFLMCWFVRVLERVVIFCVLVEMDFLLSILIFFILWVLRICVLLYSFLEKFLMEIIFICFGYFFLNNIIVFCLWVLLRGRIWELMFVFFEICCVILFLIELRMFLVICFCDLKLNCSVLYFILELCCCVCLLMCVCRVVCKRCVVEWVWCKLVFFVLLMI